MLINFAEELLVLNYQINQGVIWTRPNDRGYIRWGVIYNVYTVNI